MELRDAEAENSPTVYLWVPLQFDMLIQTFDIISARVTFGTQKFQVRDIFLDTGILDVECALKQIYHSNSRIGILLLESELASKRDWCLPDAF